MKKTLILHAVLAAAFVLILAAPVPRSTYRSGDTEVSFLADTVRTTTGSVRITTGTASRTYPCGLYDGEYISTSTREVYMRLKEDETLDLVIDGLQTTLERVR